jgi:hypothetical protein
MLWLNRPFAGRSISLTIVNEHGATVAVVSVHPEDDEVEIHVRRTQEGPQVRFKRSVTTQ